MFHVYSDRALRRLGASLIQTERPKTSLAANNLLRDRIGAYVAGTNVIGDIVKRYFDESSSSSS